MGENFQIHDDIKFKRNEYLLKKIETMTIDKYHSITSPKKLLRKNNKDKEEKYDMENGIMLGRNDSILLDFGEHTVGRININLSSRGSPPDAPVKFKLYYGETKEEALRNPQEYSGWLSASWLQEELKTIDVLPADIQLKRRFTFRYIRIEMIDTSPKFIVNLKINCKTETSADLKKMKLIDSGDNLLREIDKVSQKTLAQCMQEVFEDGPKRDRRMWLGDLRLEALANYETFENNLLVRKSLYRFAAITTEDGLVSANVFIEPELVPDDTFMIDYSLFFGDTLLEYFKQTKDQETLDDLYDTASEQVKFSLKFIKDSGEVILSDGITAHVDWQPELNKTVSTHAIFIYSYKKMKELAEIKNDVEMIRLLNGKIDILEKYAMTNYYSTEDNLFMDSDSQQKSIHSQVWMVLAKVGNKDLRKQLLNTLLNAKDSEFIWSTTPYMYHHYVEALLIEDFKEEATELIKNYWGGMVNVGADTFWEIYNPEDLSFSPYGDYLINSYCHAWSCTPCYLFRKYEVM